MKKKKTALLLAIFLGGVSAHRFYVGKTGSAIAQMCTLGGIFQWWIRNVISIAKGTFTDVNGNSLQ